MNPQGELATILVSYFINDVLGLCGEFNVGRLNIPGVKAIFNLG
jgi:hypothetical protein